MTMTKPKRGGAGRGQGRKPLFDGPIQRKSIDLPKDAMPAIEAAAAEQCVSVSRWIVLTVLAAAEKPASLSRGPLHYTDG